MAWEECCFLKELYEKKKKDEFDTHLYASKSNKTILYIYKYI